MAVNDDPSLDADVTRVLDTLRELVDEGPNSGSVEAISAKTGIGTSGVRMHLDMAAQHGLAIFINDEDVWDLTGEGHDLVDPDPA
jgi:hypothetical protein